VRFGDELRHRAEGVREHAGLLLARVQLAERPIGSLPFAQAA
jgi:hypothetical protein